MSTVGAACVAGLCLTLASCREGGVGGDVADEGCPEGEVCVSDRGLRFFGATPADLEFLLWIRPTMYATAVGGTQRITFEGRAFEYAEEPLGVVVRSEDESVLTIEEQEGRSFVVRGRSAGTAMVRVESESGELHDQIRLTVAELDAVELRPLTRSLAPALRWAFFRTGGEARVVFALHGPGSDGEAGPRLIDESAAPVESATVTDVDGWTATIQVPEEGEEVRAQVRLGSGELREATAPLVSAVDRWVRVDAFNRQDLARAPTVYLDHNWSYCFQAMAGGRAVFGAPLAATSEGPLEVRSVSATSVDEADGHGGVCVGFVGTDTGDAVLVLRGGGAELRQPVRVVAP